MKINQIQAMAYQTALSKGWHDKERELPELIALIHSELSEALESDREGRPPVWYDVSNGGKPEGAGAELADAVIRIFDCMECLYPTIEFERVIMQKMEYNKTRSHKHGGKLY